MNVICGKDKCTGCRACLNICSHSAIQMVNNKLNVEIAVINKKKCIDCGLCKLVCPQNNVDDIFYLPKKCYASWSLDNTIRWRSASGGVAAELYRWAIENDIWIAGVSYTEEREASFTLTKDFEKINSFQNSKYVYSNMKYVYKEIIDKLKKREGVLFIGLPCQVDGLRKYLKIKKVSSEQLILVDLICHGTAPNFYLVQHIEKIEHKKQMHTDEFYFRDPDTYTYTFTFTLKQQGKSFYSKKVESNDTYQVGYHKGIIYRENCYQCKYACMERTGDITLADFSYVGTKLECTYDNKNVSCVLVNSSKGIDVIQKLEKKEIIFCEERPIEEEIDYEQMLHRPTPKPQERKRFVEEYSKSKDFDSAMWKAARKKLVINEIIQKSHIRQVKVFLSKIIPKQIKNIIKNK